MEGLRCHQPITAEHHERRTSDGLRTAASPIPCDHETEDTTQVMRKKPSRPPGAGAPFWSASRSARRGGVHRGRNGPLGRNETIRPRDRARSRPLRPRQMNRETLNDRLTPLTPPQQATNHPEQPIELGKHDSQTGHEDGDARIDDESLHRGVEDARAGMTTTRNPVLRAHTTRVIERTRKRNTVAETHFRSDLSR